ncbi:putative porin [Limibacter armeniacum]|uniref:putative porin n=1 Tax=Limibacter armeniacum TaxID=466084 RepID=UPI002FE53E23
MKRLFLFLILSHFTLIACFAQERNPKVKKDFETAFSNEELAKMLKFEISEQDTVSVYFNGDFRARYDAIYGNSEQQLGAKNRRRLRYRVRIAFIIELPKNFEVGIKLTSSDLVGPEYGGDPISGNTSFTSNGSKKYIFADWAYASWTPSIGSKIKTRLSVGKFKNPNEFSDIVFDNDYTPEGIANKWYFNIDKRQNIVLNCAYLVLDENADSSEDPHLVGAYLGHDYHNENIHLLFGGAYAEIRDAKALTNEAVPNSNIGNTRDEDGAPIYAFKNLILDGAIGYNFGKFGGFDRFSIQLAAEYLYNFDPEQDNKAWTIAVRFGEDGKKNTWSFTYRYKYLEKDSWYEEIVDSDFGAYYQNPLPNSGEESGYRPGTNIKGHRLTGRYSLTNNVRFSGILYLGKLIQPLGDLKTNMERLQVNVEFSF